MDSDNYSDNDYHHNDFDDDHPATTLPYSSNMNLEELIFSDVSPISDEMSFGEKHSQQQQQTLLSSPGKINNFTFESYLKGM